MAPPTGLCAGCHAVGGREFVAGDPTKVTHGPDLEAAQARLRPDYVKLWIGKPVNITADNKAYDFTPVFSADGKSIAYTAMKRPGFEADRQRVTIYDVASRKTRTVTENWDR